MLAARTFAASIAGVILIASGCTSTSPVVRGQSNPLVSPQAGPAGDIQQVGFHKRAVVGHPIYDATLGHDAHIGTTFHSYEGVPRQGCGNVGGCPTGNCPPAYGYGGHYGSCHNGTCGHHGCSKHQFIRDSRSYSYKQPKDLVYPMQNQGAGLVTYPYYTHKGPSDFFRE